VPVQLWEWVVSGDIRDCTAGVSMTCHGAMEALSTALTASATSASGRVLPLTLIHGAWESFYIRGLPTYAAQIDSGVIHWRKCWPPVEEGT
jgi:hypothetical protein